MRRRIFLGDNKPYTEIAYLKSTGTQYIDTLYKPNQNTKIVCTMKADEYSDYGRLFGCNGGTSWNSIPNYQMNYENGGSLGNFQVLIGNNTSWSSYSNYKGDYNKHDYVIDRGNAYRDGTLIHTNNAGDFQCTTNLAICCLMYANGTSGSFFRGRVYSFQIYDDDVLVRDFVPVKVEGVGYLYDKVTKQLFGNQGSGAFICGPDNSNKALMTSTTNPEVLAICYAQGWCADASYMTYGEADGVGDIGTAFQGSNIVHFGEFEHFTSCSALASGAFNGCSSLEDIILPSTVKSIGGDIFRNCASLKTISGYDNITSIAGQAHFQGCSSLESFNWKWGMIPQACFKYCSSLLLDFNPNIINNVGAGALSNVSFTITDFNLSLNQSILNGETFAGTNVKNITFWGSTFTTIYQYAFSNCRYLESIGIPSSVSTIYYEAFRNCTNLKEIRCEGYNAPQLSLNAYDQTNFPTNGVIKVPIGATGYDQGGWAYLVNNKGWVIEDDEELSYLTFEAVEASTFTVSRFNGEGFSNVSYSLDSGSTWTTWTAVAGSSVTTPSIAVGEKIMWKGNCTFKFGGQFSSDGKFKAYGNIGSLKYGNNFAKMKTDYADYLFIQLFANSKITRPPVLPFTSIGYGAYNEMFANCIYLESTPKLPATNFPNGGGYYGMFKGCTSLTTVGEMAIPRLLAGSGTYSYMFQNCTSLTTAPDLLYSGKLIIEQYYGMFNGCTHLNYVKMLASDVSEPRCLTMWLGNVAPSGTLVKNSQVTLPSGSDGIPNGWTVVNIDV